MKKIIAILCFLISAVLLVSCAGNAGEPEEPQVSETAQSEAPAAVEESAAPKDAPEPSASASQTPQPTPEPTIVSTPTPEPAVDEEALLGEFLWDTLMEDMHVVYPVVNTYPFTDGAGSEDLSGIISILIDDFDSDGSPEVLCAQTVDFTQTDIGPHIIRFSLYAVEGGKVVQTDAIDVGSENDEAFWDTFITEKDGKKYLNTVDAIYYDPELGGRTHTVYSLEDGVFNKETELYLYQDVDFMDGWIEENGEQIYYYADGNDQTDEQIDRILNEKLSPYGAGGSLIFADLNYYEGNWADLIPLFSIRAQYVPNDGSYEWTFVDYTGTII